MITNHSIDILFFFFRFLFFFFVVYKYILHILVFILKLSSLCSLIENQLNTTFDGARSKVERKRKKIPSRHSTDADYGSAHAQMFILLKRQKQSTVCSCKRKYERVKKKIHLRRFTNQIFFNTFFISIEKKKKTK